MIKYLEDGTKVIFDVGKGTMGFIKVSASTLMKILYSLGIKIKW